MARVVVVDPDEDFGESMRLVLERAHYDTRVCRDATEAMPLVDAGVHVLVDDETPTLLATLAGSGAHVIGMHKPMSPRELLAALASDALG